MRRKRLNHAAQQLCQMFCGWQLHWDKPRLSELGSGTLAIDVLTTTCTFNGAPIDPLKIAAALKAWLSEDLARHSIPFPAIQEARLVARLSLTQIGPSQRSTKEQWFGTHGQPVVFSSLFRCDFSCEGQVRTDEATYSATYDAREEWPPNWPEA